MVDNYKLYMGSAVRLAVVWTSSSGFHQVGMDPLKNKNRLSFESISRSSVIFLYSKSHIMYSQGVNG